MEDTKGLFIVKKDNNPSLSAIKKGIVLFVLGSMLLNGFAYGANEARRNSLTVVAGIVAIGAIEKVFSKYNDSLMVMSNKIGKDIYEMLMAVFGMETGTFNGTKGEKKEESGASGNGATGEITIVELRKQVSDIGLVGWNVFEGVEKLFKLYKEYKIPWEGASGLIIMTFIMFVAGIIQRKEISASVTIILNRGRKIRISA